jgi:hypothetical protein
MDKNVAAEIICVELLGNLVKKLEETLTSQSFKREIFYHGAKINVTLQNDFNVIVEILQNTVDKFYFNYYDIAGFQCFMVESFESNLKHNLALIKSCKKLLKFIE